MNLEKAISLAFSHRSRPAVVVTTDVDTTEYSDARWFLGKEWREISWEEWVDHSDAFYGFDPSAFTYYLPSVLVLASKRSREWFRPADSLLQILDRSPCIENWDSFMLERMIGLTVAEYAVLGDWILFLSGDSVYESDTLDRSFDTVNLLRKETQKVRSLTGET